MTIAVEFKICECCRMPFLRVKPAEHRNGLNHCARCSERNARYVRREMAIAAYPRVVDTGQARRRAAARLGA